MNELCTKLKLTYYAIMHCMTVTSFVMSFLNFEKFLVKLGFPFTQLNRTYTQNLGEKINFDMFYKNYC